MQKQHCWGVAKGLKRFAQPLETVGAKYSRSLADIDGIEHHKTEAGLGKGELDEAAGSRRCIG